MNYKLFFVEGRYILHDENLLMSCFGVDSICSVLEHLDPKTNDVDFSELYTNPDVRDECIEKMLDAYGLFE